MTLFNYYMPNKLFIIYRTHNQTSKPWFELVQGMKRFIKWFVLLH